MSEIKVDSRIYYDHGDNDNSDTGTVLSIREQPAIPFIQSAETLAMVLYDKPGEMSETSITNLRLIDHCE